jgi:hypothetical protein
MTTAVYTPARLFAELPDRFENYGSFEQAFVEHFNTHRFDFPTGYGWRDALGWGLRRDVVRRDGDQVVIRLDAVDS